MTGVLVEAAPSCDSVAARSCRLTCLGCGASVVLETRARALVRRAAELMEAGHCSRCPGLG